MLIVFEIRGGFLHDRMLFFFFLLHFEVVTIENLFIFLILQQIYRAAICELLKHTGQRAFK